MKALTLLAGAGALALAASAAHAQSATAQEPHPAHTGEDRFDDSDLTGNPVDPDSAEARAVMDAMENNQSLASPDAAAGIDADARAELMLAADPDVWDDEAEAMDVSLLQTFLMVDANGDLLISPAEWTGWQGEDSGDPFGQSDYNSSGMVGFNEFRVWNALTHEAMEAPGS